MKSIPFAIVIAALATACSSPKSVDVHDLNQQFISAWNNKDANKLNGMLADDVQFVEGESHFNGKQDVQQKWVQATLPTLSDLKTNVVSSAVDNATAYEAGTFSVDVLPTTQGGPRGYGEGNFMLLWRKGTDDTWKLSYAQIEGLPVREK